MDEKKTFVFSQGEYEMLPPMEKSEMCENHDGIYQCVYPMEYLENRNRILAKRAVRLALDEYPIE